MSEEKKESGLKAELKAANWATEKQAETDEQEHTDEFHMMEQRDESQIMDEMKGHVIDKYIYDFSSHGRRVVGLSYAGVIAVARKQGNLKILELKVHETDDAVFAKAKGRDDIRNFEIFGVASQAKEMVTNYGKFPDSFAAVKAVAKAQRNVLRRLIPEQVITTMVQEYQDNKVAPKPAS